jgi:Fic family protein
MVDQLRAYRVWLYDSEYADLKNRVPKGLKKRSYVLTYLLLGRRELTSARHIRTRKPKALKSFISLQPASQDVVDLLKEYRLKEPGGGLTAAQVRQLTGLTPQQVYRHLRRLEDKGLAWRDDFKVWRYRYSRHREHDQTID